MSETLKELLSNRFGDKVEQIFLAKDGMVTMQISPSNLLEISRELHDNPQFEFKLLIDICGVDYKDYGCSEWRTAETTFSGFSRGASQPQAEQLVNWNKSRFASVYHLLSISLNQRLRLHVCLADDAPKVPSVFSVWNAANWFEREAFDLFGIVYEGHPDLRRLLTDYGFVGHPFRKDFPLIGEVELRYDARLERCVYEPVSIQPRVNIPKVIREDNRYLHEETTEGQK